ncbi:alpha-1,3-mannosyl-glycoprotein 4-beta-N-acetylglucosaminyltransferase C-like [Carassius auratus]|uniref:Alpha-1,3-mannosyl-glycoprotein 4-beta-N-acetylglucosaminyltransferase C-like n=1 Tax=Carassius auratus TaxID=7957 RepID=A0A6P6P3D7_CARAU|nr:alpha-1,3-mannosyl-glycoprotein 4-beta-N-acetylglucosaminyltransferase C-like [Carassius auratus]
MRCYLKNILLLAAGLFILTRVYIHMRKAESGSFEGSSLTWIWDKETWMEDLKGHYLHFNVSIKVLAGVFQQSKKYLTVGISSVKREKGSYLQDTLQSIYSASSEEELDHMVVVVLLADFDVSWIQQTLEKITNEFHTRLSKGQLLVIHANEDNYPPLTGLKRNFNDASDRVSFRSKQNVDYSYLLHFSSNLSKYYVMLEDDVSCSKNFLSSIREHIHSMSNSKWITLEFSKLGYIGKLYQSRDLPILARFLYNFYQEMPCDFLLSHFHKLLMQEEVIRFRPSLFQHMGTYSSFKGTINRLKDEDFVEEVADNPPADISTNIETYQTNTIDKAYSQGLEYFWGVSPIVPENYILVVFHEPVLISRVQIHTGLDGKDELANAEVELGKTLVKKESEVECSGFDKLGAFQQGQFNEPAVQKLVPATVACLRIRVTAAQTSWVVVRKIQVWTVKAAETL